MRTSGKKQYRSAIMYHNEEQKGVAEKVLQKYKIAATSDLLQPASAWHDAEEYHQKYAAKQMSVWGDDY